MSSSLNILIILLILSISIQSSYGRTGAYSDDSIIESQMACLKQSGIDLILQVGNDIDGSLYSYTLQNLINAKQAGVEVYLILLSPSTYDPQDFAKHIKTKISQDMFSYVWYNPYILSDTSAKNCVYTQSVTSAFAQAYSSSAVGIFSYQEMWIQKFGSTTSCSNFTSMTVGYSDIDGYDNFDDWQQNQFGGWKQPSAKVYGSIVQCGMQYFLVWKQ